MKHTLKTLESSLVKEVDDAIDDNQDYACESLLTVHRMLVAILEELRQLKQHYENHDPDETEVIYVLKQVLGVAET